VVLSVSFSYSPEVDEECRLTLAHSAQAANLAQISSLAPLNIFRLLSAITLVFQIATAVKKTCSPTSVESGYLAHKSWCNCRLRSTVKSACFPYLFPCLVYNVWMGDDLHLLRFLNDIVIHHKLLAFGVSFVASLNDFNHVASGAFCLS